MASVPGGDIVFGNPIKGELDHIERQNSFISLLYGLENIKIHVNELIELAIQLSENLKDVSTLMPVYTSVLLTSRVIISRIRNLLTGCEPFATCS